MSKTVTVSDAFWNELVTLVNGGPIIVPPPVVVPPVTPPGVKVIPLPFVSTIGRAVAAIPKATTLAFQFTVPLTAVQGQLHDFTSTPTDGNAYFMRNVCLSDIVGDFTGGSFPDNIKRAMQGANQDVRIRFTVGVPYVRPVPPQYAGILKPTTDLSIPVLVPGKTYYFNVRQVDPNLACNIDYALHNI